MPHAARVGQRVPCLWGLPYILEQMLGALKSAVTWRGACESCLFTRLPLTFPPPLAGGARYASAKAAGVTSRVTAILGAQWGDEGKGKLADVLAKKSVAARVRTARPPYHHRTPSPPDNVFYAATTSLRASMAERTRGTRSSWMARSSPSTSSPAV
jgi:hypothetical protein